MELKRNNESYETEGLNEAIEVSKGKRMVIRAGIRVLTVLVFSTIVSLALASYDNSQEGLGILPIRSEGDSYQTHSIVKKTYTDLGVKEDEVYCIDSKEIGSTRDCLEIQEPYYEEDGEVFYNKKIFYDGDHGVKLSNVEKQYIKDTVYDPQGIVEQDFMQDVMKKTKSIKEKSSLTAVPEENEYQVFFTTTEENPDKTRTEVITKENADDFNHQTFSRGVIFATAGGFYAIAGTISDAIDLTAKTKKQKVKKIGKK